MIDLCCRDHYNGMAGGGNSILPHYPASPDGKMCESLDYRDNAGRILEGGWPS